MKAGAENLTEHLLAEILRHAHRYAPGTEQSRPALVPSSDSGWRRLIAQGREHSRDLVERTAARLGFSHRHFDPDVAAERLHRVLELSEGLNSTYALLADGDSRQAIVDVLKLRVLGPFHATLQITPQTYRARQAQVDRELRSKKATFEVSDPWFSPLSLYQVPVDGGSPVSLHSHSVDVVSVFVLNQYSYLHGARRVQAQTGDVVLDIGGCWGDTALYFASLVGPTGKVYTFEFDPESLEILRANLSLNPRLAERIEVVEHALWDSSGEVLDFRQAGRMTTVIDAAADATAGHVSTITLDDFVEQRGIDRIGFVKMDVEGAELRVLSGAQHALKKFAPNLAIAAYHHDDDLGRIPEVINSLQVGYRLYLKTASPVEEESVLFATRDPGADRDPVRATSSNNAT
jgi:FkbM family methyltransferase